MRKTDIDFHSDHGNRSASPAVNVKIHGSGSDVNRRAWRDWVKCAAADRGVEDDPRFTEAWIDAELSEDDRSFWWDQACARGWEQIQNDYDAHAPYFWGPARVMPEGRSNGWAVIYTAAPKGQAGRPLFDRDAVAGWDAIALAKWAKFAKWARQTADDVPYQYLDLIYHNVFLPWADADLDARKAAHQEEALSV